MARYDYRCITAGRTLLTCTPLQFEQFANPEVAVPRSGAIEEAAHALDCKVESIGGLWYVTDLEDTRLVDAERSRRAALVQWWKQYGLVQIRSKREAERAWEQLPRQGRPSTDNAKRTPFSATRSEARETSYQRIESIWMDANAAIIRHTPQADIWMTLAVQREMPRQHMIRKVGQRRAVADAVAHLYDVEGHAPLLRDLLGGAEATEEAISGALLLDVPEVAAKGEAAGVCARIALMLAVVLSPEPPAKVFDDLHQVLVKHEVKSIDELKLLCELAVGG